MPEGHGNTNPRSPTPNDRTQKPHANTDLEEEITKKVNTQIESMIDNLSNIIKKMIKEEIKNAKQKGLEPPSQRPVTRELEPSIHLEGNNVEGDEDSVGFRKVQRRGCRMGQSRDDNTDLNSAGSSTNTNQPSAENRNILGTEYQQRARLPRNLQAASKMSTPLSKIGKGERINKLKSTTRLYSLFLGRLDESTTSAAVFEHLKENGIMNVRECVKLNTRGRNKCFKLAVDEAIKNEVDKEELWPKGDSFDPFVFAAKQRREENVLGVTPWNTEGLKSLLNVLPDEAIFNNDIRIFCETVLQKPWNIEVLKSRMKSNGNGIDVKKES